jgi:hypothetical protein
MDKRQVISLALTALLAHCVVCAGGDATTVFSLVAPPAKAVFVAGEFNHWSQTATPLKRDPNGRWSVTVPLPAGKHAYKFVVDGEWKVDDANPEQTRDGFGGLNSVMTVTDSGVDPVVNEKDAVRRQAMGLLGKSDFAQLERTAEDFRRTKSRFSDGLWKLKEFYDGLTAHNEIGEEKDWRPWFEKLDRWREEFPESITLPVVGARGWLDYTTAVKDAEGRKEAIGNARTILEAGAKLPTRCPHWYLVMEEIAGRQGWEPEEFSKLVAEAAAAEPTYYDYYAEAASYFLSRRRGKEELDRVAKEAATKFDPAEGMAAYARTVWFMENHYDNIYEETTVTWPKLREGFLDIQKRYPESRWNANAFCRFAVQAKDRQTASVFFNRIGDHGDPNWGGYGRYEMAKMWADPATPSWRIEPMLTIMASGKSAVHSIAFSPDGQLIASGTANGRVTLRDATTGKELWSERVASFPVMSVAFSPDGKLLAAGAGEEYRATEPGVAKVWNVETKAEIASGEPKGVVWRVAFTPDGKTLALSGGKWEGQAESSLLDITSGALQPLPWTAGHDHILKTVAVSPDGRTLATDCYQSLTVWSLAESRVVFDNKNVVKDFVLSLTYAPDGKSLVSCGAPMRGHNDNEPGELTIWDTATWKPRTPREQRDAGGLVGLAYSPDGKLIAAGGYDRAVHVWDAGTLESKAIFIGHDGMIWTVAFAPDGKRIASAGDDGAVKIWKLP